MMAFAAMASERLAFLFELYTRSAGDARQGMPYEALIDALGFDERVTRRIQRELERERFVDLTTVPPMTHMGRPVMDHAPRHRRQQKIGMPPQGSGSWRTSSRRVRTRHASPPRRLHPRKGEVLISLISPQTHFYRDFPGIIALNPMISQQLPEVTQGR
jgi:hypothetical protein